jgi:hypothetical protein
MDAAHATRRPFYVVVAAIAFAGLMLAAWHCPVDEAATLGVAGIFVLLCLSCYYWVIVALVALRRSSIGALVLLGVNGATLAAALVTAQFSTIYLVFSCGIAVLLAVWLGPDALATLRGEQVLALVSIEETPAGGKGSRKRRAKRR